MRPTGDKVEESKQRSLQCSVGSFDQKQLREERAYLADRLCSSIKGIWSRYSAQGPEGGPEK